MKQVDLAYALILFTIVAIIACVVNIAARPVGAVAPRNNEFQIVSDSLNETDFTYGANIAVVMVEGCEWIVWSGGHCEINWTHKGNCTSCRKLQRQLQ